MKPVWGLIVAAAMAVGPGAAVAQSGAMRSTLDGVYTEEQAQRGEQIKRNLCAECHEDDEFTFILMESWAEGPASGLFQLISTEMPEDNPGSLAPEQYADVLAYIFKMNGMPTGSQPLEPTNEALRNIIIRQKQ